MLFCGIYFVKFICLQSVAHNDITTIHDLFIYFNFFNRSSILDPSFPVNLEVKLITLYFFSATEVYQLFQSNQRFQAIEFADRARPVPEKLDVGFLFYGHDMIVKYKATRINTSVTHT